MNLLKLLLPLFACLAGWSNQVTAQGLLRLQKGDSDYQQNIPLTWNLSLKGGYDSMQYSDPSYEAHSYDSMFMQTGLGMVYSKGDQRTRFSIGLDLGASKYFEEDWRGDDLYYNARIGTDFSHRFNQRVSIQNNFFMAYEIEPDYTTGFASGRRLGQYVFASESVNVAYAWSDRVSTTTGYTFQGIVYVEDDDQFGAQDDRYTHIFRQDIRYRFNRKTSLLLEYRYGLTNYDRDSNAYGINPDYHNHYVLVGVDHAWSARSTVSVRAGAEWYKSDLNDSINPYLEASVNHRIGRRTDISWFAFIGSDGADLGNYESRTTYRTGINANHQFTEKFSMNAGLSYGLGDYEGNEYLNDVKEHQISANLGFNYNFYRNLSLQGSYSYTTILSDESFREYDRHRVDLGLNASF